MKIFFEEYEYPIERVKSTFESGLYSTSRDGEKARLNAVGYYYSTKVNDSVFILPKVFLFEEEKEIGEEGEKTTCISAFKRYDPLKIIDIDSESNPLKEKGDDAVVFELSTWIYLAIKQYNKRNENNRIVEDNLITNVKSIGDHHSVTYLDIILSLRKFNKEHRHLFTFISIINSKGHNKINWRRTINNIHPVIQDNIPFYLEYKTANKIINYDEELIVLFYSVLEYLKVKCRFKSNIDLNYNLIKPSKIQSMIETKKGTRILKRIRHKFFKDELVALWKLLYTFFDKSEQIAAKNYSSETLLARQFNNVFEDMIDMLLSDPQEDLPDGLKDQPDGKRVDHIYRDQSLLDDSLIYYIGDSKYYKDTTSLGKNSIYKQFTYAKNVIQINLNIYFSNHQQWLEQNGKQLRYRDDLTEGYNITPNFFIRGNVDPDNLDYSDHQIRAEHDDKEKEKRPRKSFQFKNRLFDRDTMFTKEYNINFLYVLAAYAANADNRQFKYETREIFREDIIKLLNTKYDFYVLEAINGKLEDAVNNCFQLLLGKIYRPYQGCDYAIMALEKIAHENSQIIQAARKEFTIYSGLDLTSESVEEFLKKKKKKTTASVIHGLGQQMDYNISLAADSPVEYEMVHQPKNGVLMVMMENYDKKSANFISSGKLAIGIKLTKDSFEIVEHLKAIGFVLFHHRSDKGQHLFRIKDDCVLKSDEEIESDRYKNIRTAKNYVVFDIDLEKQELDTSKIHSKNKKQYGNSTRYDAQYATIEELY